MTDRRWGTRALGRYRRVTMGFNPFRARAKRRTDLVFVVAAFAVVIGLVVWAVRG